MIRQSESTRLYRYAWMLLVWICWGGGGEGRAGRWVSPGSGPRAPGGSWQDPPCVRPSPARACLSRWGRSRVGGRRVGRGLGGAQRPWVFVPIIGIVPSPRTPVGRRGSRLRYSSIRTESNAARRRGRRGAPLDGEAPGLRPETEYRPCGLTGPGARAPSAHPSRSPLGHASQAQSPAWPGPVWPRVPCCHFVPHVCGRRSPSGWPGPFSVVNSPTFLLELDSSSPAPLGRSYADPAGPSLPCPPRRPPSLRILASRSLCLDFSMIQLSLRGRESRAEVGGVRGSSRGGNFPRLAARSFVGFGQDIGVESPPPYSDLILLGPCVRKKGEVINQPSKSFLWLTPEASFEGNSWWEFLGSFGQGIFPVLGEERGLTEVKETSKRENGSWVFQ